MAGLYIHVPFCSSRCVYCGFYSTTRLDVRGRYVDALCREMMLRDISVPIDTVYLGGGTPSQLNAAQLSQLFDALYNNNVSDCAEITIECNPDDITASFSDHLAQLRVNRVSMGAQTFSDERLLFLRRRHRASQVRQAVEMLRFAGIGNISIDLMYGFPGQTLDEWHRDIDAALSLDVEHISAYALTYEESTPLWQLKKEGRIVEAGEELQRSMYYDLKDRLEAAGFEHYELSNFARKMENGASKRSRHNSGYWNHTPYIGLGAAAHSFDGRCRLWNVADLDAYMEAIEHGYVPAEGEQLTDDSVYNETVMTSLRTCEGLDLERLLPRYRDYCLRQARRYVDSTLLRICNNKLFLTREGLFVSDMVMSDLMMV